MPVLASDQISLVADAGIYGHDKRGLVMWPVLMVFVKMRHCHATILACG